MIIKGILIGIILVITGSVCFTLGKVYYGKKIMPYKLAEYTFDLLFRVSENARKEILDFVGNIGANKQEILDEINRVESKLNEKTEQTN